MNHIIIQVRGTNGSGKSSVCWGLLERFLKIKLRTGDGQVWAYQLLTKPPLYVFGRYEYPPSGGCDNISTLQEQTDGVEKLAKLGDVVFEGAMTSTIVGRWVDVGDRVKGAKFIHGYMDTPIEKCIKRILHRRKKAKIDKVLIPEKSVIPKFHSVARTRERMEAMGLDCRTIPHKHAVDTILEWLKGSRERRFPRVPKKGSV